MRIVLILVCLVSTCFVYAQEVKHQVSFGGNQDVAWNGSSTSAKFDSSLDVDDYTSGQGNFAINYLHSASENVQIGFLVDSETNTTEVKFDSGSKSKSESKTSAIYLLFNYNFNSDFKESWYVGLGIGRENIYSESEDTDGNKSDSDSSIDATVFYVSKRFSMEYLGIQNLTYAPMISYIRGNVNGDLEDDGIKEVGILTLDILKLDLLF